MPDTILGSRIREIRRKSGLTQAELARRIGISASYLNLIERNKRRIAGQLLSRTAEELGVRVDMLGGAGERRLLGTLQEIAHMPTLAGTGIEGGSAGEFIGRFPSWARAVAVLVRAEREATSRAGALADRLTHDPFLGETVHRMLTRISAIRSAAEILSDYSDLPAEQRARFDRIVLDESRALSEIGDALAAYFDRAGQDERSMTPLDEVETLFEIHQNRFDELERLAEAIAVTLPDGVNREQFAQERAENEMSAAIEKVIAQQAGLAGPAASRAREALTDYAASAMLLPQSRFSESAEKLRYDAEQLAAEFRVSVQRIAARLTALPRNAGTPRFGLVQINAAGTIRRLYGMPGLAPPRYGAACPLWAAYRAQQTPETMLRQRAVFPTGERFVLLARAYPVGPAGFGRPRHLVTDMLVLTEHDAALTVYSVGEQDPEEAVGQTCHLCPRADCAHRVADPFLS